MRLMKTVIPWLLLLPGCLQTWHQPTCEEASVTEVADDEPTEAGTADDVLARVAFGGPVDGTRQDGTSTPIELDVRRAAGSAEWVVLRHATKVTRTWGFGASYPDIYVYCDDHLRVPVDVVVETAEGDLSVAVTASVQVTGPGAERPTDERLSVFGTAPFSEAAFPAGEHDPAAFEDKRAFVALDYEAAGFGGAAGWEGEQHTDDYLMSVAERLVTFLGPE